MTANQKSGQKSSRRGWFERVFAQRASVSGHFLQLYLAGNVAGPECFGVSISKRVCPSAVARNYCKRTLREGYRRHSANLLDRSLVIRVRRGFGRREFNLVGQELAKLLRRIA